MAEVKNKVITVESLAAVNTHNKDTYMTKDDPTRTGTMTMVVATCQVLLMSAL